MSSIATALDSSVISSEAGRFLRGLHQELQGALVPEMRLTLRVAVLSAAGHTRPQIVKQLGSSDVEIRMAQLRLQRIAEGWK